MCKNSADLDPSRLKLRGLGEGGSLEREASRPRTSPEGPTGQGQQITRKQKKDAQCTKFFRRRPGCQSADIERARDIEILPCFVLAYDSQPGNNFSNYLLAGYGTQENRNIFKIFLNY